MSSQNQSIMDCKISSNTMLAAAAGFATGVFTMYLMNRTRNATKFTVTVTKDGVTAVLGGLSRTFPRREVKPGVHVALFNPLGDYEMNEAIGQCLLALVPKGTEYLFMPDGKAQALLHVLGRLTGLPTIVARKEAKPYMKRPLFKGVRTQCMTSKAKEEAFYLGSDDAELLKGKKVVVLDDVVSTGGSIKACRALLESVGAEVHGVMCAFTEGDPNRKDGTIALGNLPVNHELWTAQ